MFIFATKKNHPLLPYQSGIMEPFYDAHQCGKNNAFDYNNNPYFYRKWAKKYIPIYFFK